ncbi:MAG: SDR family NAD(P)-dependent oxidoreductase, partial [Rikenellaceae bacterium]
MELFNLTGKVALVTGATHGLGMAMAMAIAKAGATLVINGHSPEKMKAAIAEYAAEGVTAHGYLFDVTSEPDAKKA